jgi:uncharacterized protein (TIGR00730 family)
MPKPSHAIPHPPPHDRRSPLPWHCPKCPDDDPGAAARVERLLESPSYRQADLDPDLLQDPALRGVRLQLEHWKAEHQLEQNGIAHTIVVYGSTRIVERAAARRDLDAALAALAADPGNAELRHAARAAERHLEHAQYYDMAREFGRIVGQNQDQAGVRLVVMTGGGPGIMEAANRGAFDVGAKTVGLNITLPHEQFPNPYITPELCFGFRYFALRKMHFLERARALVVFPGGFGTFDELFETLTLLQTRKIPAFPVVLVGERFWRRAFDLEFLVEEGMIAPEDAELFWFADSPESIWSGLLEWYARKGEPLVPPRATRANP